MPQMSARNRENGQILLVVVLASVIALTVGLAAISRSITNTRVSSEEASSQKALAAAEAGIEEQLNKIKSGSTVAVGPKDFNNNSNFNAQVSTLQGTQFRLNSGQTIVQDDGADIWLSTYANGLATANNYLSGNTNLAILWNTSGADCTTHPAIEIAVLRGTDPANPVMQRYAYDTCAATRQNGFTPPITVDTTINENGTNYRFNQRADIVVADGRIVRVIPLYANAEMGVLSNRALPAQGYIVSSTGESGSTVRKVRVFQGFPRIPIEFFPYNLFLP